MRLCYQRLLPAMLAGCSGLYSQTMVDLRTQAKSADFSAVSVTKPFKTGTMLPSTCTVAATFFKTDAPAGRNIYACTAPDTWSLQGGNLSLGGGSVRVDDCAKFDHNGDIVSAGAPCATGSGGVDPANAVTMASPSLNAGSLLVSTGAGRGAVESACREIDGTMSCPAGYSGGSGTTSFSWFGSSGDTSRQIVGSSQPFTSSFTYRWSDVIPTTATLMKIGSPSGNESTLEPATPDIDYVTPSGAATLKNKTLDNTNAVNGFLQWIQIPPPAPAASGTLRLYAKTGAGLCWVNSLGAETCPASSSGGGLPDPGTTGILVETAAGATANRTLAAGSSNLSITNGNGAAGNPTIDIGPAVDFTGKSTSPVQVGSIAALPGTCAVGQLYYAADGMAGRQLQTCAATNAWAPVAYGQGTSTPATCAVGQIFFKTDATAGQNLYYCTATNAWTQQLASADSSGGSGGDTSFPDATVFRIKDDFTGYGSTYTGELNWTYSGTGCVPVNQAPVINHPGIMRLTTGTTSGTSYCEMHLSQAQAVWPDMMAFGNWETQWIVKPGSATGISVRAGLSYPGSVVGLPPAIGYWVQYDTSQSDTAWTGVVRVNNTTGKAVVNLGVTPTATDWYRIRIRSTVTGTVLFSVATNGGPFSAEQSVCAAGCNATGAMPSVQMVPFVQVATYTAGAAAFVDFDWFGALVTGLAR